jgi:uncharacterized protein with ParB-like and HNH nuclease domain
MLRYNVRSRQVLDLVNDLKSGRLILSPYFQRNLVWRAKHKHDFIETIILGYPFPQIFVAKGGLNIEKMEAVSCVVDGQQRLNSIKEYVNDGWPVNGRKFSELDAAAKEDFVKYEVAIIELDMYQNDPRILEIFKRLNRTFYALSTIERNSTEYGSSEFMLVAKVLSGELNFADEEISDDLVDLHRDPNITPDFVEWSTPRAVNRFQELLLNHDVFTPYEISRMVPLQFTLNVMATCLKGIFNRNEGAKELLEEYKDGFDEKEILFTNLNKAAHFVLRMRLSEKSIWLRKANLFSLLVALYNNVDALKGVKPPDVKITLENAAENLPEDYKLAAREAVNNRKERTVRDSFIVDLLF